MSSIIFCENCGKPMSPSKIPDFKGLWYCACGFVKESNKGITSSEKIKQKVVGGGVVKNEETAGFPHVCKKCKYGQADVDIISAFYSDESDISLYRCKKCGHVERETDGTSNAF